MSHLGKFHKEAAPLLVDPKPTWRRFFSGDERTIERTWPRQPLDANVLGSN
ncbi:hypothetical protein HPP92_001230 [Vanilla planifolia]|uniref:Uncharacterized protein n=1 Tax=Vanilla planifolia TaxID=51239 RepID=A0A835VDC7_VANPL|nr:hypothetical protein HPP92_001230 [Vanilla planifolia]